jgi:hypothetical protein
MEKDNAERSENKECLNHTPYVFSVYHASRLLPDITLQSEVQDRDGYFRP